MSATAWLWLWPVRFPDLLAMLAKLLWSEGRSCSFAVVLPGFFCGPYLVCFAWFRCGSSRALVEPLWLYCPSSLNKKGKKKT